MNPGKSLGSYRILDKLGQGGMGKVYRAKDTARNREVAIKVVPELLALDPDRLARFTRGAQTLAARTTRTLPGSTDWRRTRSRAPARS